jgi:hypothetical protein
LNPFPKIDPELAQPADQERASTEVLSPPVVGPEYLVVTEEGHPVAGADVTLDCYWPEIGSCGRIATWKTDNEGRFILPEKIPRDTTLPPIPPRFARSLRLRVRAADLVTETFEGTLPPERSLETLRIPRRLILRRGVTVRGLVLDSDGAPREGAEVQARSALSSTVELRPWSETVSTDERDAFSLVAPGKRLVLFVSSSPFAPSAGTYTVSADPLRITLKEGTTISGTVVDLEQKPASGVTVIASWGLARVKATTRAKGAFQLVGVPDLPVADIPIAVLAEGYDGAEPYAAKITPPLSSPIQLRQEPVTTVTVRLL